jgi:hypothetical protein
MALHESKAGVVQLAAACTKTCKALQSQLRVAERDKISDRHFCDVFGLLRHVGQCSMRTVTMLFTGYVGFDRVA